MRNILLLLTLILVACGPDNGHFRLKGHLLNLNQGEFYVYSPDGALEGIDTIKVAGGRFTYEPVCRHDGMAVITLPNGMEIPVFMAPGKSASIEGNAHNLKDLEVEGGDENELLTKFRKAVGDGSDRNAEVKELKAFIAEHPESPVGVYLLRKYVLASPEPDYALALSLTDKMLGKQKENVALQVLRSRIATLKLSAKGAKLPRMTGKDIMGETMPDVSKGTWVICCFASWDYDSGNILRRLAMEKKDAKKEWDILGVSYDASDAMLKREKRDFQVFCDGKMADSPMAEKLGFVRTGQNILARNGKIIARDLPFEELKKELEK